MTPKPVLRSAGSMERTRIELPENGLHLPQTGTGATTTAFRPVQQCSSIGLTKWPNRYTITTSPFPIDLDSLDLEANKIPTYITSTDDRIPNDWRLWTLCGAGILTIVGVFLASAIKQPYPEWPAQWPEYFLFADRRAFFKVANFGNVMSNVPLLFTGAWGCYFMWHCQARRDGHVIAEWEKRAAFAMFFFIICTGIGSAFFHFQPSAARLFWDRLPMVFVFMLFLAMVIGDRLSMDLGRCLLPVLLVIGLGSVVYWRWSEANGAGDLRPYGIVQFYPMLAIPFLLFAYPPRYTHDRSYIGIFGFYLLAKILEFQDPWVFSLLGETVSGHSLKHLAVGCATWFMVDLLRKRRALL
jgi:hypothetical protein